MGVGIFNFATSPLADVEVHTVQCEVNQVYEKIVGASSTVALHVRVAGMDVTIIHDELTAAAVDGSSYNRWYGEGAQEVDVTYDSGLRIYKAPKSGAEYELAIKDKYDPSKFRRWQIYPPSGGQIMVWWKSTLMMDCGYVLAYSVYLHNDYWEDEQTHGRWLEEAASSIHAQPERSLQQSEDACGGRSGPPPTVPKLSAASRLQVTGRGRRCSRAARRSTSRARATRRAPVATSRRARRCRSRRSRSPPPTC